MKKHYYLMAVVVIAMSANVITAQTANKSVPIQKNAELRPLTERLVKNNVLNPELKKDKKNQPATRAVVDYLINEDFNGMDGNDNWLPEGWTVNRKTTASGHAGWQAYTPGLYSDISSPCMLFGEFDQPVDEWLITPSVKVADGMELSFYSWPSALWYFDSQYLNKDTFQFEQMVVAYDFKINISDDKGATWTELKSLADDFKDITNYYALYAEFYPRIYHIDLSDYDGKEVQIGFQVVGYPSPQGVNASLIDDVYIGYPPLNLSYSKPAGSLYFGLTNRDLYVPKTIVTVPVYSPVTFNNGSNNTGATYSWVYMDTDGEQTSTNKNLTVTYRTNYEDDFTTRNNVYDMPTLVGTADKKAKTEFTYPYWVQAGGKGEYEITYTDTGTKEVLNLGLSIVDPNTDGTATWADFGSGIPYFGYSPQSDWFWTKYMLNGDDGELSEDTYMKLLKHGNIYTSTATPLVITGVHTNGYGRISDEAEFKAELYLVNRNWVIPEEPYATAICKGKDAIVIDRNSSNNILSFNFEFDNPIEMSTSLSPYYFIAISGFHDPDNVEYYSPEMSEISSGSLAWSWLCMEPKYLGESLGVSWTSVAGFLEDSFKSPQFVSFYIMVDGYYPWLEGDDQTVELALGKSATVSLDSYYDGSDLKFEGLPAWLTAEAEGRYDKTMITFTSTATEKAEADVTVKAPGVSKTFKVTTAENAGVDSIEISDPREIESVYTLSGVKVASENLKPGFYIVKMTNGDVVKTFLK